MKNKKEFDKNIGLLKKYILAKKLGLLKRFEQILKIAIPKVTKKRVDDKYTEHNYIDEQNIQLVCYYNFNVYITFTLNDILSLEKISLIYKTKPENELTILEQFLALFGKKFIYKQKPLFNNPENVELLKICLFNDINGIFNKFNWELFIDDDIELTNLINIDSKYFYFKYGYCNANIFKIKIDKVWNKLKTLNELKGVINENNN